MNIKLNLLQKVSLGDSFSITGKGYLKTSGQIARPGSQRYLISDLGIGDEQQIALAKSLNIGLSDSFELVRPKKEVLKSVESFNRTPFCDLHPRDEAGNVKDVTPENVSKYMKGMTLNPVGDDAGNITADFIVWDKHLIDKIKNGQHELSAGYSCDIRVSDDGKNLEQVNIRPNHVASVPTGRCGPACSLKIGDNKPTDMSGAVVLFD